MNHIKFNINPFIKYIIAGIITYMMLNYQKIDRQQILCITISIIILMVTLDVLTIYDYDKYVMDQFHKK